MSPNRIFKNYKLPRCLAADPLALRRAQNIIRKVQEFASKAGKDSLWGAQGDAAEGMGTGELTPCPVEGTGGVWAARPVPSGAEKQGYDEDRWKQHWRELRRWPALFSDFCP